MIPHAREKWPAVAVGVVILALAVSNVLLIRQNLQLRAALAAGGPEAPRAGDVFPAFAAAGLRGEQISVSYPEAGAKRVLLYFTPTCRYCRGQFAYWREILGRADRERFEVIGIASDREDRAKLEDYLRQFGCDGASSTPLRVALVPDDVLRSYKLSATPTTLVVNNDGAVERA